MNLTSDPGVFLVVAMVACIHGTFLWMRRRRSPFRWSNLAITTVCVFLPTFVCCPIWYIDSGGPSPVVWLTPLICGLVIGSVAGSSVNCGASAIAALAASAILYRFGALMGPSSSDVQDNAFVPPLQKQFLQAQSLVLEHEVPVTRGFLPLERSAQFGRPIPVRSWHTLITGVDAVDLIPYRVWTPGGDPRTAAYYLRLVPEGMPEPVWTAKSVQPPPPEWPSPKR